MVITLLRLVTRRMLDVLCWLGAQGRLGTELETGLAFFSYRRTGLDLLN